MACGLGGETGEDERELIYLSGELWNSIGKFHIMSDYAKGESQMEQNAVTNYVCQDNLNTRVSIHQKYHTSEDRWEEWLLKQYNIANGSRVLEIGCGTGYQWVNQLERFGAETEFIFSDISPAMVDGVKGNFTHIQM